MFPIASLSTIGFVFENDGFVFERPEELSQLIKTPRQVIITVDEYCHCAHHVASSSSKQAQASNQVSDMISLDWHVP